MTKLWQQLEPTHKLNLLLPALKYKLRTSVCFISKVLPQSFCDIQMVSLTKLDSFFRLQENGALEHQQWQLICFRWKPDFCDKSVAAGPIMFIKVFCWMKLVAWFHYVPLGTYPAWLKSYSAPFLAMFLLVPPLFDSLTLPATILPLQGLRLLLAIFHQQQHH